MKVYDEEWKDRIRQAEEGMTAYIESATGQWTSGFNNGVNTCVEILDKLIAESEGQYDSKINNVALSYSI